jgi:hypothetical protein
MTKEEALNILFPSTAKDTKPQPETKTSETKPLWYYSGEALKTCLAFMNKNPAIGYTQEGLIKFLEISPSEWTNFEAQLLKHTKKVDSKPPYFILMKNEK